MILLLYIVSIVFSFGALYADMMHVDDDDPRGTAAGCLFFSLLPVINVIVAVFGTGFCQHGFRYWK